MTGYKNDIVEQMAGPASPLRSVRDDRIMQIVIPHRCLRLKQHSRKTADAGPNDCGTKSEKTVFLG